VPGVYQCHILSEINHSLKKIATIDGENYDSYQPHLRTKEISPHGST